MERKWNVSNIIIGILVTLFLISFGVFAAVQFRPLYYFDVDFLNIPAASGLSKELILENYNALIDYCSPFYYGSLVFPSIPASPSGIGHFEEVKVIFHFFFYLGCACLVLLIPLVFRKVKRKEWGFFLVSSVVSIVLPAVVGIGCALNFDRTFVIFHKIFFRNDDWLFDPVLDPVITILPQDFFLHCALFIAGMVLFGSLLLFLAYRIAKRSLVR